MLPLTNSLPIRPISAGAAQACCGEVALLPAAAGGSRRRRIWELSPHAHCPVIGMCLPISVVRKLVDKVQGKKSTASDYEVHCGLNTECKQRNPFAEAVQKELDRRYGLAVRQSQAIKCADVLAGWWRSQAASGQAVAGALWAVLTHPRCDTALEEDVLHDVHMLQHQNGAAERADLARLNALLDENQVLTRELAGAQQRSTQYVAEQVRRFDALQSELMRARADLIGRDTVIASLRDELRMLEAAVPALRSREELSRRVAGQVERIQDLERALLRTRHELERERQRADDAASALQAAAVVGAPLPDDEPAESAASLAAQLGDRAVLCVGGRPASVPVYRQLIEQVGARFLHHDGGEEDNAARLDSTLAAADLVICQTGCISHGAYWRVKDHCKRTGKRCVFVENPSSASLKRALIRLQPMPRIEGAA